MKLGIIREYKSPPDRRVALSPAQCRNIMDQYPNTTIVVESSPDRIFPDDDYIHQGVDVVKDMSDCDVLLGIKEVPPDYLLENKTYMFFAHVIKKQPYNQPLMMSLIQKKITLVDYEVLTNDEGQRLLGFGTFAGIVGAYNGLISYYRKLTGRQIPPAHLLHTYTHLTSQIQQSFDIPCRVVITGGGRVGKGAVQLLKDIGFEEISPDAFLNSSKTPEIKQGFTHLTSRDLYEHQKSGIYDREDFYHQPQNYQSAFMRFAACADVLLNGVYWTEQIPRLFTRQQAKSPSFAIKVIADISCDIEGSVPITLRASSINNPVYGWDRLTEKEISPYTHDAIDIMAVNNLPSELPAEASIGFGQEFITSILPDLTAVIEGGKSSIIERATICSKGTLKPLYHYLQDYVYP
jgi:saccharopine dehydrogenase (NAD+, L-lysine forming)